MTLQALELKKYLAQSNMVGLRSEEIKKSCHTLGTGVLGELPSGAENFAQSLKPSAYLFLVRGSY
jgi:hypothetical protein